ncbi:MAG TPA: hypothetical protein VGP63_25330 [Planctomycetaceae bacterium]|jgi:hypothetical protein|nr:hypothetical protein [Planctomycetaceae bacterium]
MIDATNKPNAKPRPRLMIAATALFTVVVLSINLALARVQVVDHFSWGAMAIALEISPLINGTLLVVAVVLTPVVRRFGAGAPIWPYVVVAVTLTLLAIVCQIVLLTNDVRTHPAPGTIAA